MTREEKQRRLNEEEKRKSLYSKSGSYAGYDKNNKEREALDYYSTPVEEVKNILERLFNEYKLSSDEETFSMSILEPCCGGGHMIKGIIDSLDKRHFNYELIGSDIKERYQAYNFGDSVNLFFGSSYDFLSDNYPVRSADYIIMNPPYSVIEPFTMKALSIAKRGVLMLGRLQFLEGSGRYEKIFCENPPSDVYVVVDRIACFKNGDVKENIGKIQAYAWYFWDFTEVQPDAPRLHWIRRADKQI